MSIEITAQQTVAIPLDPLPGTQTITLTLQAGNFRPADQGKQDTRRLSFAIRSINLRASD